MYRIFGVFPNLSSSPCLPHAPSWGWMGTWGGGGEPRGGGGGGEGGRPRRRQGRTAKRVKSVEKHRSAIHPPKEMCKKNQCFYFSSFHICWGECIALPVFFSHGFLFSLFPHAPSLGWAGPWGGGNPMWGDGGGGRGRKRKTANGVKSVGENTGIAILSPPKCAMSKKKVFRLFTLLGECIALSMLFCCPHVSVFSRCSPAPPPGAGGGSGGPPTPKGGTPGGGRGGAQRKV